MTNYNVVPGPFEPRGLLVGGTYDTVVGKEYSACRSLSIRFGSVHG